MSKKLRSRIVSVILTMAIVVTSFIPVIAFADTGNNEDDTGSLYVPIGSENFLSLMSISTPIKHYVLTEDIVISGDWKPISNFTGTFDGGGHTITFNIDKSTGAFVSTQYLGLFASCTDATIKNLYVNGNISLTTGGSLSNPNVYVGGVVASSTNSTLENVHFSGNIAHAKATIVLGNFLQSTDTTLVIELENEETLEIERFEIQREIAKDWFASAVKADAGIGEDPMPFPKELFVAGVLYPFLASNFGDV